MLPSPQQVCDLLGNRYLPAVCADGDVQIQVDGRPVRVHRAGFEEAMYHARANPQHGVFWLAYAGSETVRFVVRGTGLEVAVEILERGLWVHQFVVQVAPPVLNAAAA